MIHDFPTTEEVVAIHDAAVRELGGSMGLRDMGALESAFLFRFAALRSWLEEHVKPLPGP